MIRRLVVVTLLVGGITAATVQVAFAEDYKFCLATSSEGSGHEGDYVCVNVPLSGGDEGTGSGVSGGGIKLHD